MTEHLCAALKEAYKRWKLYLGKLWDDAYELWKVRLYWLII